MNASLPLCALALILTPVLTHAATCESLTDLTLPGGAITAAVAVPAGGLASTNTRGAAALANLPAFCRVSATLRPTADSDIKMEIWLPDATGWNGKYEANGNGGWTGSISTTALANGLRRGYAASMSDLGHEGSSAEFAVGHPEKLIDFAPLDRVTKDNVDEYEKNWENWS